jgi:uncharacterized protein (TIGR02300 family)
VSVAKPEWGRKRMCHGCGALFYDLRRDPILCPKCGTEFDPEAILRSRRSRVVPAENVEPEAKVVEAPEAEEEPAEELEEASADLEEEEEEETKAEEADTLLEDASGLTEDEDDVAEVREHLEEEEET